MFARYVEVLLVLPASPRRDVLLRRAFAFVEEMLASGDDDVRTLAYIGFLEGLTAWWFARAAAFVGPLGRAELDRHRPRWWWALGWKKPRGLGLLERYGVRHVIAAELRAEGVTLSSVPGTTYAQDL